MPESLHGQLTGALPAQPPIVAAAIGADTWAIAPATEPQPTSIEIKMARKTRIRALFQVSSPKSCHE